MLFMTPPMWVKSVGQNDCGPPVFFFGSNKRFAGLVFVTSSKAGSDLNRSVE